MKSSCIGSRLRSAVREVASAASRSRSPRTLGALGAIISLSLAVIAAEPLSSIPNPRTRDGTWVVDVPGILRAETIARLNASISDLERATGAEV